MSKIFKDVYEPEDDSKLLLSHVNAEVKIRSVDKVLNICEVGVGSGFVISNIAKDFPNNHYFGCDINQKAIEATYEEFDKLKMHAEIIRSDLLEEFGEQFDIILFNTPYFPFEDKHDTFETLSMKDRAIYGGKHGYETIVEFILQCYGKLKKDGVVYMIFSTLSNPEHIAKTLDENFYKYEIVGMQKSFFEKIICMKFQFSEILQILKLKDVKAVKYLARGKHSVVLEGNHDNQDIIIKIGKEQHIQKEKEFMQKLQKENFIPKYHFGSNTYVAREKLNGTTIVDFFEKANKKELVVVLNKILKITQRLDELKINKFEMTNPYKHIYVNKSCEVKMIDYERCIYSEHPKNTTQVLEFFRRYKELFDKKQVNLDENKILNVSKKYKDNNFKFTIKDILKSK